MYMKWKYLLILMFFLFIGNLTRGQVAGPVKDTSMVEHEKEQKNESLNHEGERNREGMNGEGNVRSRNGQDGVKQVRSARPDMSKARGARPPQITRPSGSGIPKGIGRPGGAKGPGRR